MSDAALYDNSPSIDPLNRRQRLLVRKSALWQERSDWDGLWRDIAKHQHPSLGRFTLSDTNRADQKRRRDIIDNTAVFASRTLSAGMMSGMTSPARPWFRLGVSDEELNNTPSAKAWLHLATKILLAKFGSSNTYRALHSCYTELGLFGTWASVVLPHPVKVLHHYPLTVGTYAIETNYEGEVTTLFREFRMTVGQIVEQFGLKNCSARVRSLHDRGLFHATVDVIHAIEPRREKDRDLVRKDGKNKPFASLYFEPGSDNWDQFLSESGFDRFPVLAPRWSVTGNDTYGDSPGAECRGDVAQLQQQQLRKGQAIDYQSNPPLQVPTNYKGRAADRLPGGVMYVDQTAQGNGVRSAFEVNLNLDHLHHDIQDVRERIRAAYYADLFLMIANDQRTGVTATEIAERHEEKLLMLGPVLERLHNELLQPMIEMALDYGIMAGVIPPPPEELQGQEMSIDFISVLAQAQRAVAVAGMDRLLGVVGSVAELDPTARHKLDVPKMIDVYGEAFGVDPDILRNTEEATEIAQAEAEAAQQQMQIAQAPQMAGAARDLSQVDPNNMSNVLQSLSGYGGGANALEPASGL